MIPFDLTRLDSNVIQADGDHKLPVMDRIFNVAKVVFLLLRYNMVNNLS